MDVYSSQNYLFYTFAPILPRFPLQTQARITMRFARFVSALDYSCFLPPFHASCVNSCLFRVAVLAGFLFQFASPSTQAATRSPKGPVIPKWGRFEHTFKSSIAYSNPVQQ